jgi:alkylation response protein AidB-like acyl-CoA dehydrogenase
MNLELSQEQESVRQVFAAFFEKESTIARVRQAEEHGGFDPGLWKAMVATGVPVMGADERAGGGGADLVEEFLVAREAGRRLAAAPVVESLVASRLLGQTRPGGELVAAVAEGGLIPTIAVRPATAGVARQVPAGAVADLVLALGGEDLLAVRGQPGDPVPNLAGLPVADRHLGVPGQAVTVLASGERARRLFGHAVQEWKILTAAVACGIQEEAQRIGLEYVLGRRVFGTQLASFQAVQHRFADVATAGRGAYLLTLEAAWSQRGAPERTAALAEMALLFSGEAAFHTCRESLQFHGGYGYTLEYGIQLYFRRAKALCLSAGPSRHRYQELARSIAGAPAGEGC